MRSLTPAVGALLIAAAIVAIAEPVNVAVTDLQAEGIEASSARVISDRLRTELFATGAFTVVERGQMDQILKEQGFQQSGCTSDECAVEVGQILGVKYMIAGSIGKVGQLYALSARMIDVGTSTITQTASVDCKCPLEKVLTGSTADIAKRLAAAVQGGTAQGGTEVAERAAEREAKEGSKWWPPSRGQKVRLWVFGGLSAAALGAGILLDCQVADRVEEAEAVKADYLAYVEKTRTNNRYPEFKAAYEQAYQDAKTSATSRNVAYGAAGAFAVGLTLSFFF